jgi:hypothetical protein
MAWGRDQVTQVLSDIIRRSQRDPAFRELCLQNPAAAVKAITSEELPEHFRLRFVDNDRADLTVVLPDPVDEQTLSDAELSSVTGGILLSPELTTLEPTLSPITYSTPLTAGACFAAGTLVLMADRSWRAIEMIGPGAMVLGFKERTGSIVPARVSRRVDHAPEPIYRATLDQSDRDLFVTGNHPFYSDGRWCAIDELETPSALYGFDANGGTSSPRRLLALELAGRTEPVYNIEVDDAHTYFAGGVLVHNGGGMKRK